MNSKSKTKSKIKLAYIVLSLIILLPLVMLLAGCGEDPEMRIVVNFEEAETKANNDYYIVLEEKNTSYEDNGEVWWEYTDERELTTSKLNGSFYKVKRLQDGVISRFSFMYPTGSSYFYLTNNNLDEEIEPVFEKFEKIDGSLPTLKTIFLNEGWGTNNAGKDFLFPDFDIGGSLDFIYDSVEDVSFLGRAATKYHMIEMQDIVVVGEVIIDNETGMPLYLNGSAYENDKIYQTITIEVKEFRLNDISMPASQTKVPFFEEIQNIVDFGLDYIPQVASDLNLISGEYSKSESEEQFSYKFETDIYKANNFIQELINAGLKYFSNVDVGDDAFEITEVTNTEELTALMGDNEGTLFGFTSENRDLKVKIDYGENSMAINFVRVLN